MKRFEQSTHIGSTATQTKAQTINNNITSILLSRVLNWYNHTSTCYESNRPISIEDKVTSRSHINHCKQTRIITITHICTSNTQSVPLKTCCCNSTETGNWRCKQLISNLVATRSTITNVSYQAAFQRSQIALNQHVNAHQACSFLYWRR